MAKKSFTVVSPVRFEGQLYGEGEHLSADPKDLEGVEHCLKAGKPKTAATESESDEGNESGGDTGE